MEGFYFRHGMAHLERVWHEMDPVDFQFFFAVLSLDLKSGDKIDVPRLNVVFALWGLQCGSALYRKVEFKALIEFAGSFIPRMITDMMTSA